MAAKVGLTGGIGSGKSTVSNIFGQLGIRTIDADTIALQLSQPDSTEYDQIVEWFGEEITDSEGLIIRSKLAKIVFSNSNKRKSLESILHPSIRKIMYRECEQNNAAYCILEIPLLIESGQYKEMDEVLVVTCNAANRIKRLQLDRGMRLDLINSILETQITDKKRIRYADSVIVNDLTIPELENQVRHLHEQFSKAFSQQPMN